jgi:hypothetical protein
MANKRDTRPELMALKVDGGWIIQALAHNGDSAWLETNEPVTYAMAMATILGMCASGEYDILEPRG